MGGKLQSLKLVYMDLILIAEFCMPTFGPELIYGY